MPSWVDVPRPPSVGPPTVRLIRVNGRRGDRGLLSLAAAEHLRSRGMTHVRVQRGEERAFRLHGQRDDAGDASSLQRDGQFAGTRLHALGLQVGEAVLLTLDGDDLIGTLPPLLCSLCGRELTYDLGYAVSDRPLDIRGQSMVCLSNPHQIEGGGIHFGGHVPAARTLATTAEGATA